MEGSTKDAWYTAYTILPIMKKLDHHKKRSNIVAFHGASNAQKEENMFKEHLLTITVMQDIKYIWK
jgi:hypothetical protein